MMLPIQEDLVEVYQALAVQEADRPNQGSDRPGRECSAREPN